MPLPAIEPAAPADFAAVSRLLEQSGLPRDGLAEHFESAWVARAGGSVVGCAALELHPDGALLRSVAVSPSVRRGGLGGRLVEVALERARARGSPRVFLLTETATEFFAGFGFAPVPRAGAPPGVAGSAQLAGVCCASATFMARELPAPPVFPFGDRLLEPVVLEGQLVRLVPLGMEHRGALLEAARDPEIFRFTTAQPGTPVAMAAYIGDALREQAAGRALPFAVVHRATEQVVGSTRFGAIVARDRGLEIGWTWYAVAHQRTGVNTECKYLLLRHAFEVLLSVRVQLKTDVRNLRSQAAIERIGATREGVLRAQMVRDDGTLRDTVMYSIVAAEWSRVREHLLGLLRRSS